VSQRLWKFVISCAMEQNAKLIGAGLAGVLVSMLCCLTPVLAVLLGAIGLTAWVAKLDYVLIPAFVASLGLVIFAVVRRTRACPANTTRSP
jgi:mercuric ion transport protein